MWRASSCRMRRQTWRSTASFDDSASMRNSDTAKVSATSCRPIVLRYQDEVPSRVSKISRTLPPPDRARRRAAGRCSAAAPRCGAPRRRPGSPGRTWRPGPARIDELAAQQHRAVLALHQGRQPPARDAAVELDAVGLATSRPRSACRGCRPGRRRSARRRPRAPPPSRCRGRRSTGRAWPARRAGAGRTGRWHSRGGNARCCASRPGARVRRRWPRCSSHVVIADNGLGGHEGFGKSALAGRGGHAQRLRIGVCRAMFVADRLVDCTHAGRPAGRLFVMLGYAVMAAQIGIVDMVIPAGRRPISKSCNGRASSDRIGRLSGSASSTASGWSSLPHAVLRAPGRRLPDRRHPGLRGRDAGLRAACRSTRPRLRQPSGRYRSGAAPFVVFPLHDIEARCLQGAVCGVSSPNPGAKPWRTTIWSSAAARSRTARARHRARPMSRSRTAGSPRSARSPGKGRRGDRRQGPAGHAGLRRHPHPL